MKRILLLVSILAAGLMLCSSPSQATPVEFLFNAEFSRADAPKGASPWLSAVFKEVSGGVELTLRGDNLVGTEFVTAWYFSLNPSYQATALTFSQIETGILPGNPIDPIGTVYKTTQASMDQAFKADGVGGYFDIRIEFPNNKAMFGVGAKAADNEATFLISGIAGLTAEDFRFLSDPKNYFAAAKVQGIYTGRVDPITGKAIDGSGWVAPVPEPATMLLLGSGLIGLAAFGRKRFRRE